MASLGMANDLRERKKCISNNSKWFMNSLNFLPIHHAEKCYPINKMTNVRLLSDDYRQTEPSIFMNLCIKFTNGVMMVLK